MGPYYYPEPVPGGLTCDEARQLAPGTIVELLVKYYPSNYEFEADPGDRAEVVRVDGEGNLTLRWTRERDHDAPDDTYYPGSFKAIDPAAPDGYAGEIFKLFGC